MSTLYVVATPIGNLNDISARALAVLAEVDVIAAEDTRHSGKLLGAYSIKTPLVACHDHNEQAVTASLVKRLADGQSVALISDAGTPLLSDPGYRLVRAATEAGIRVVPVPGPSAIVTALSAAGLPTDRFCFEGFLPSRGARRRKALESLSHERRTIVLFEAPHRIRDLVDEIVEIIGSERPIALARELTKQYEQIWTGTAAEAAVAIQCGDVREKGEFVVMIEGGADTGRGAGDEESRRVMAVLLRELAPGPAASIASELLGQPRKHLYEIALTLKKE